MKEEYLKGNLAAKLARARAAEMCALERREKNGNRIMAIGLVFFLFASFLNWGMYWLNYELYFNQVLLVLNIASAIVPYIVFRISNARDSKEVRKAAKRRRYYTAEYNKVV